MINFNYSYSPNLNEGDIDQRFAISFKATTNPLGSWRQELVNTAKYIRSQTDKQIIVPFSGGIDSEVVCRAFIEAGIPFKVMIVRYDYEFNLHDISYALNFCTNHGIDTIQMKLDILHFFIEGHIKYIDQDYRATNIFRYLQLYILEEIQKLDGCAVFGGGELFFYNKDNQLHLKYSPDFLVPLQWNRNNSTTNFPYFYQTTPNIMASFLEHPLMKHALAETKYFPNSNLPNASDPLKRMVYFSEFSDMVYRPKQTGFEKLYRVRGTVQNLLQEKFKENQIKYIALDNVKLQLGI